MFASHADYTSEFQRYCDSDVYEKHFPCHSQLKWWFSIGYIHNKMANLKDIKLDYFCQTISLLDLHDFWGVCFHTLITKPHWRFNQHLYNWVVCMFCDEIDFRPSYFIKGNEISRTSVSYCQWLIPNPCQCFCCLTCHLHSMLQLEEN